MVVNVHLEWESGFVDVNMAGVVRTDTKTQNKIFKEITKQVSHEKTQDVLNFIAWEIRESRRKAANSILRGHWPIPKPIPAVVLDRFEKTIPEEVLSLVTVPKIKRPGGEEE